MIRKGKSFFIEVTEELKKVNWTKKEELIASTSAVLITVIILSIYIGFVDLVLTKIIDFILR